MRRQICWLVGCILTALISGCAGSDSEIDAADKPTFVQPVSKTTGGNASLSYALVNVLAYHWKGHTVLDDVAVNLETPEGVKSSGRGFASLFLPVGSYRLTVAAPATGGAREAAVDLKDALATLKLAIGVDAINGTDPEGKTIETSAYQRAAADFNADGKVDLKDALEILKYSIAAPTTSSPRWQYFHDSEVIASGSPPKAELTIESRGVSVTGTTSIGVAAVLVGDVDGSWRPSASTPQVAPSYYLDLLASLSTTDKTAGLARWGMAGIGTTGAATVLYRSYQEGVETLTYSDGSQSRIGPSAAVPVFSVDGILEKLTYVFKDEKNTGEIRYSISGTVYGLESGGQLTLINNGKDPTPITTNGSFAFKTAVTKGGKFIVEVAIQPQGQTCVVGNSAGSDINANVPNLQVDCAPFGVTEKIGAKGSYARAVAIQVDGKIVVAGVASTASRDGDFALARYHPDGRLDTSFGGKGFVTTNISGRIASTDWLRAISIQSDGRIVVAGYSVKSGEIEYGLILARYNSDGSLDSTFAGSGFVKTTDQIKDKIATAVAVQDDGKIVVAGAVTCTTRSAGKYCTLLERYNTDGTLDLTFKGPSVKSSDYSTTGAAGMAIQADGKILVVGTKNSGNGDEIAAIRFSADGQIDSAFGKSGVVNVPIGSEVGDSNSATGIALQTDGKILISGVAHSNSLNNHFAVTRLLQDGSLDMGFGRQGSAITMVAIPPNSDFANSILVQADGAIVVAGESISERSNQYPYSGVIRSMNVDLALARYSANGNLDTTFGRSGIVTSDLNLLEDRCYAVALDGRGGILCAGETSINDPTDSAGGYSAVSLIRYDSKGAVDRSFGQVK